MQVPCQDDIVTVPLSRNGVCVTQQCLNMSSGNVGLIRFTIRENVMSTVLVVDDSATLREMVCELLTKSGIQVICAGDGVEAKEQIQTNCPDLVVMDIVMPRMNGYDLCRWLKNHPKCAKVPVVICSSKNQEFDRYWGMKQGADAYIAKPFHPAELVDTVKMLLRG